MQIATVRTAAGTTEAAVVDPARGAVRAEDLFGEPYADCLAIVTRHSPNDLRLALDRTTAAFVDPAELTYAAPYLHPPKIWGIGLNYVAHASDLAEKAPQDEPASFMKGDHTIIGPGEPIPVPWQSRRTTAEAELGVVIGRECRNVSETEALDYAWGVVPVLDQTAEDILEKNPRFLTRAKNFPGFLSFGPAIVPMDEVLEQFGALAAIEVATVLNGSVHRANRVALMTFGPEYLISFHSMVMPLFAGDLLLTGTPGAAHVRSGDVAECRIDGIGTLQNPVFSGSAEDGGSADD